MAVTVQASEWSVTPQLSSRAEHSDNPRLSAEEARVDGSVTDASVLIRRRTESSDFTFVPALQHREFAGDDTLDGSDESARLAVSGTGERNGWSLGTNWLRQSTLTSELGTTGFTQANKQRQDIDASLNTMYQLNDRLAITAGVSGSDTRYLDAERTGLVDYRYFTGSTGARWAANERLQWSADASAGRLHVPGFGDANSWQYSVTARADYKWSSAWKVSALAGPSRVRTKLTTDDGGAFGATLTRDGERTTFRGSFSRTVKPTGRGVLVHQDAFALMQRWELREHLAAEVNASALRSDDAAVAERRGERVEYWHADAALLWAWSPNLRWRVSVGHSTQRSEIADFEADGHSVSIGFSWAPQAFTLWR